MKKNKKALPTMKKKKKVSPQIPEVIPRGTAGRKRDSINEFIEDLGYSEEDRILLADGFEDAFVGIACQFNKPLACYDYDECIKVLVGEGMTEEDAIEHMSFNVEGGWVGETTPLFLRRKASR